MQIILISAVGAVSFLVLILAILVGGNRVRSRLAPANPISEESLRRRQERLLNPQWIDLENHLETSIPETIKAMYTQAELLLKTDIPFRNGKGGEWQVAQFEPADLETLNQIWQRLKESKNFPFATDAVGDCYYVPLERKGCPVMYYHHDGDDVEQVSDSLEQFLSWRQVKNS